jgi:hypothetical protein
MINTPRRIFRVATYLTALYTRLDLAREAITTAIDQLPKDFDIHQIGRINDIRNILSREMMKIWDMREDEEKMIINKPVYTTLSQLIWKDDTKPDRPGLWAFMSPQNDDVYYQPVSQVGVNHPERWECGRWCFLGPVPEINLEPTNSPTPPVPSPAEDQNRQLAAPEFPELDSQTFPPDPTFIEVDNPGLDSLLSNMLKDAYHKPPSAETRVTSRKLPLGGV